MKNNGWTVVKIPAIATRDETWDLGNKGIYHRKKGESIHPQRLPLLLLQKMKNELGSIIFEAQFQQEPAPIQGSIIKREWLGKYNLCDLPSNPSYILLSWDTACKAGRNNDYSVCTMWLVMNGLHRKYYLLDVYREKIEFPKLRNKVKVLYNKYKQKYQCPVFVLVEDAVSGTPLIQDLRQEDIIIKPIQARGDKESRLIEASSIFEQGNVFLPREDIHWKTEYINELLRFPQAKHDDQVDSTTQALLWRYGKTDAFFSQEPSYIQLNAYRVGINRKIERIRSFRDDVRYDHLDPKTAFIMRKLDLP